jgi:hypothetical protein
MTVAPGSPTDAARVGRALAELTRRPGDRPEDLAALVAAVPPASLVAMAGYHRVPGVVYRSLVDLDLYGAEFEPLRNAYQMAAVAHARCLVDLAATVDLFAGLGCPWMVVKGPVLTAVGYGDPGARLYDDLDLVVSPSGTAEALSLIEGAGGRLHPVNWPMMTGQQRAELPVELAGGMLGDLHWHLLVTRGIRARFSWSLSESFGRRRSVDVGGIAVPTLDVVDGILYLCLHGSLSGGHLLVWLKDLDQMVGGGDPDWDEVIRRARRTRTALVAAVQLERARTVLATPVPEWVIDALSGRSAWWRWWRSRDRRTGPARWGGLAGTGRTFVSATSATTAASAVQLARSLPRDVVMPALDKARHRAPGAGGDSPELYRPLGGAPGREAYLSMVADGDWG